jgi:hypothetical protein
MRMGPRDHRHFPAGDLVASRQQLDDRRLASPERCGTPPGTAPGDG